MRGPETEKSHSYRSAYSDESPAFYERWMAGEGIDVGFGQGFETVLSSAKGIEANSWINGKTLPFGSNYLDYVYSSHCLEHIADWRNAIQEFHRVLKVGGYCIITVPHKFLYEKKEELPSRWNGDHKRFYTPSLLLLEIESALEPNSYRIRLCEDNDRDYDYTIPPDNHAGGCYEIVLVFKKIEKPNWSIENG